MLPQRPNQQLLNLYHQLDSVQGYFEGDLDFEDQPCPSNNDRTWASSDFINTCLSNVLNDLPVHFIDSRFSSIKDKNILLIKKGEDNDDAAALLLAEEVLQIKWKEYQSAVAKTVSRDELISVNPHLQNPIIFILNTHSAEVTDPKNGCAEGGQHWVALVILPPNYRGLLHLNGFVPVENREVKGEDEAQPARVFLIDSLNNNDPVPPSLVSALTTSGHISHEITEPDGTQISYSIPIPAVLPQDTTVFQKCSITRQQTNNYDCGYWAMYNGLMTVLEGSSQFYWSIYVDSSAIYPDNKLERMNTGLYLRELFNRLVHSQNQKHHHPLSPKEELIPVLQTSTSSLKKLSPPSKSSLSSQKKKRKADVFDNPPPLPPTIITKEEIHDFKFLKLNKVMPLTSDDRIGVLEEEVRSLHAHIKKLEDRLQTTAPSETFTPQLKKIKLSGAEDLLSRSPKSVTFSHVKSILIPSDRRKYHQQGSSPTQEQQPMEVEKPKFTTTSPPSSSGLTKTEKNRLRRQKRKENRRKRIQQKQLQQQHSQEKIINSHHRHPSSYHHQNSKAYEIVYIAKPSKKPSMEVESSSSSNQKYSHKHHPRSYKSPSTNDRSNKNTHYQRSPPPSSSKRWFNVDDGPERKSSFQDPTH